MKRTLWSLLMAAVLLLPGTALAEYSQDVSKLDGTWMFRGFLAGPAQPPVYVGTAQFLANGTLSGSPTDQHSGPTIGQWSRTGNYEFAFTFVADTFDSSGAFANTHRVRGTLTLSDDGLSATGKIVLEILDTTGKVIFTAPFPTTFTGARLVVLPL